MKRLPKSIVAAVGRRRLIAALGSVALLAVVAVGAVSVAGGNEERDSAAEPEVRLDRLAPSEKARGEGDEPRKRGRRPTVVELRAPGDRKPPEDESRSDRAPKRVLKENARIRQELDHLKALAAERGRVSLALSNAGASYDGPLRLGAGGLAWPVSGAVVSPFGQRWGRLHAGIDIAAPAGTLIRAAEAGRVVISAPTGGYGNYVCVQHTRRLTSCYAHLSRFLTKRGADLDQGEAVGLVGCTGHCFGDHLHFETWVGGRPVDPMPYL